MNTAISKMIFDKDLLTSFGFCLDSGVMAWSCPIADGQLTARFSIIGDSLICKVFDSFDGAEYTLHISPNADGTFVNAVREELDSLISEISLSCSADRPQYSDQPKDVIGYCLRQYGNVFEYLWDNLPDAAAVRRADNRKWYGVLMKIPSEKLGILPSRDVSVINLHVDSGELESLVKRDGIFPAYHMSKKHWVTVLLDGSVKTDDIFTMIDKSYELGGKKLKKRTSPSHSST